MMCVVRAVGRHLSWIDTPSLIGLKEARRRALLAVLTADWVTSGEALIWTHIIWVNEGSHALAHLDHPDSCCCFILAALTFAQTAEGCGA